MFGPAARWAMIPFLLALRTARAYSPMSQAATSHRLAPWSKPPPSSPAADPVWGRTFTTAALAAEAFDGESAVENCKVVSEMPPPLPELKNDFYLLRHGQSTGNVAGVISSARSLATSEKHGLTELGYRQGKGSAESLLRIIAEDLSEEAEGANSKRKRVFFYASPFARARQTAQACLDGLAEEDAAAKARELGLDIQTDMILEDGIMERWFGRLDNAAIHTYGYVWPNDLMDVTHTAWDVESVAAVCDRVRETLTRIDDGAAHGEGGDAIVLVSHADVLQITQLYAAGADNVGTFSSYRFGNGEVRAMKRTIDSLPEPVPLEPPKPGT